MKNILLLYLRVVTIHNHLYTAKYLETMGLQKQNNIMISIQIKIKNEK